MAKLVKLDDVPKMLHRALSGVDGFRQEVPERPANASQNGSPTLLVPVTTNVGAMTLACLILPSCTPKRVQAALLVMAEWVRNQPAQALYPVVVAPYVSPTSAEIIKGLRSGYLDLNGNCRISFAGLYVEREVPGNVARTVREQRPLFGHKAAHILKVLLAATAPVRITDLALRAQTSAGHASTICSELAEQRLGQRAAGGFLLTEKAQLLDMWRAHEAAKPRQKTQQLYTTLHGQALQERIEQVLQDDCGKHLLWMGASAANYYAPFLRGTTPMLQADEEGVELLKTALQATEVAEGGSINILSGGDWNLALDGKEVLPGVFATDEIATYLTTRRAGGRLREAANHLRETVLKI